MSDQDPAADGACPLPDASSGKPSPQGLGDALGQHQSALQRHFPLPDLHALSEQARLRAARRRRVGGSLAALFLLLGLGGVWGWDPAYRTETLHTRVGEQRLVALADGSTVFMDTDTRMVVSWHVRSRQVALTQGRARYAVSPALWRPFEVDAGVARVTVTGTVFDMARRDAASALIYLREGSVDVALPERAGTRPEYRLSAGMGVAVHGRNAQLLRQEPASFAGGWQSGQLVFDGVPLAEALAELQRYLPVPVSVDDPMLARLRVSGVFQVARLDQLFDVLPLVWPLRVERASDGAVRLLPAPGSRGR